MEEDHIFDAEDIMEERVFDNPFMDVHSELEVQKKSAAKISSPEEYDAVAPVYIPTIHEMFYKKMGWDWEHSRLNPNNHPNE